LTCRSLINLKEKRRAENPKPVLCAAGAANKIKGKGLLLSQVRLGRRVFQPNKITQILEVEVTMLIEALDQDLLKGIDLLLLPK
jgi:hypothetical protein